MFTVEYMLASEVNVNCFKQFNTYEIINTYNKSQHYQEFNQ